MLVRFTVLALDPDSGRTSGILVAAHGLRDEGDLSAMEHRQLRLSLAWFNQNVPVPAVLKLNEHRRAISWFKPAAKEAIRRMWGLKAIMDLHGHPVDVLRCADPGTVVYEDEVQLVAKPYKGQRFR